MKNQKMYEPEDEMISLIRDNYNVLQSLGMFGISLGFGDKTVQQVCDNQHVDCKTFLAVVNFTINGYINTSDIMELSVPTLLHYLKASHGYYLEFQLPFTRKQLVEALDAEDSLAKLILHLYDDYAHEIRQHMRYEEKTLFPYVQSLIDHNNSNDYSADTFSKHHNTIDRKLRELKSIILKYLPSDSIRSNQLTATLYDIYNNEEWLTLHASVEEQIFMPAIKHLEQTLRQHEINTNISKMIGHGSDNEEALSEREREVVISVVQGMANKEIADHLNLSIHTVITHRRNIARKLQIHSPAGLTIYAIVNGLVDITNVKM